MATQGYTTPPPQLRQRESIDPPLKELRTYSYIAQLWAQDLKHVVDAAGRREIKILIAHVNADAATLLWMLVARDQIDTPMRIGLSDIDGESISKSCMSHLINDIERYAGITDLVTLRNYNWSFSIRDYFTNLETYYDALAHSIEAPVHETCLKQISDGLIDEANRLKVDMSIDFLKYFNLVQSLLMRLDDSYYDTPGYHNHYSCGPNTQKNQTLVMDTVLKIILSIMYPYMPLVTARASEQCYKERYEKKIEHSLSENLDTRRQLLPALDKVATSPRRVSRVRRRSRRKSKKLPRKSRRRSHRRSRRNKR